MLKQKINSLKTADRHGRMELPTSFLLWTILFSVFTIVFLYAIGMMAVEHGTEDATITGFGDSLWLGAMAVSTIGFGDHFATTTLGRLLTVFLFATGPVVLGAFFAVGQSFIKLDSNVTNREQMTIIMENTRILNMIQEHLGIVEEVNENAHGLDVLLEQEKFDSFKYDGWISLGVDNTQVFVISICALPRQVGHLPIKRHIYAGDKYLYARELFDWYCKNPNTF